MTRVAFRDLAGDLARFNGPEFDAGRDANRLSDQMLRIWALMVDQRWRTLAQIAAVTGDPPASVSAQLRHLRKRRFGTHTVNRRHIRDGLFEYQVLPSGTQPPLRADPRELFW